MAFGEIHLTPSDSDSYSVGATITNAVRYGDYFQLVYHGAILRTARRMKAP